VLRGFGASHRAGFARAPLHPLTLPPLFAVVCATLREAAKRARAKQGGRLAQNPKKIKGSSQIFGI
jgi:hypothetical protein